MLPNRSSFALFLALSVGALAMPSAGATQTRGLGMVNGTVTSEGGDPIAGATVKLAVADGSVQQQSDSSGRWVLMGIGKGEFVIEVSKAGFETKRMKLIVERESMQSPPVKIALKKSA